MNTERACAATGELPSTRRLEAHRAFTALPASACDDGCFDGVVVNRERLVMSERTPYSVPTQLVGRALPARIHRTPIDLVVGSDQVASHPRCPGQHQRLLDPAHCEAAFKSTPPGRSMRYRDWRMPASPKPPRATWARCATNAAPR